MRDLIPVFAAETLVGLGDVVAKSGQLSFAALALPDDQPLPNSNEMALAARLTAKGTNLNQDDLYYLKSILASTGINKNDDFFERMETWAARKTPEDKPFNYEHHQDDIIGHITASAVMDVAGKIISDDVASTSLPDKFHVLTTAVLYRYCDIPDRQKRTDTIIAEVAAGKWYVSMECLFNGFDYLLIPLNASSGTYDLASAKLVERNDKTAFLTKHLRAYGGKGEWQNHKVGRVLRNILFHGKGLVRKPANPESVIYNMENEPLSGSAAKIMHVPTESGYGINSQENATGSTSKERNQMTELEINELKSKLAVAEAKVNELQNQNTQKQLDAAKAELVSVNEALKQANDKTAAAESAKVGAEKLAKTESEKAAAATKESEAVKARLAEIEAERRLNDRIVKVKAAYDLANDEDAKATIDAYGFADMNEDKFTKAMAAQTDYLAKKKAEYQAATKLGESKVTDLPAPMSGEPANKGTVGPTGGTTITPGSGIPGGTKTATATQVLDAAVPATDAALAVSAEVGDMEVTAAEVLKFFSNEQESE